MAEKLVLADGMYKSFLKVWGQTKDVEYNQGFKKTTAPCFVMEWEQSGYVEGQCKNYAPGMEAPSISYYSLHNVEKGGGKVGMEPTIPWSEFKKIFLASKANPNHMGQPVYDTGVAPGSIMIEVKALPGSGNYPAKNVQKSWQDAGKAEASVAMFVSSLAEVSPATQSAINPLADSLGDKKPE